MMDRTYRRNDGVVQRRVAGEDLLVPIRGTLADLQRVHILEGVAGFIWERLDGSRPLGAIRDEMVATFGVDRGQAEEDLSECVAAAEAAGLVAEVAP